MCTCDLSTKEVEAKDQVFKTSLSCRSSLRLWLYETLSPKFPKPSQKKGTERLTRDLGGRNSAKTTLNPKMQAHKCNEPKNFFFGKKKVLRAREMAQ